MGEGFRRIDRFQRPIVNRMFVGAMSVEQTVRDSEVNTKVGPKTTDRGIGTSTLYRFRSTSGQESKFGRVISFLWSSSRFNSAIQGGLFDVQASIISSKVQKDHPFSSL